MKRNNTRSSRSKSSEIVKNNDTIFQFKELRRGRQYTTADIEWVYLICVESGEALLTCEQYGVRTLYADQMIIIPREIKFNLTGVSSRSRLLIISCADFARAKKYTLHIDTYSDYKTSIVYDLVSTGIKPALKVCIKSIVDYKRQKVQNPEMFKLKLDEFAICLEDNYSPSELAYLFYPLMEGDLPFKKLIVSSYTSAIKVQDLIEISHLCRTVFYEKFKQEFGMTAKQWILKQKMKMIEQMVSSPEVRVKDLIQKFNFASHEHFYSFCRRHFDCKPKDLRIVHSTSDSKMV